MDKRDNPKRTPEEVAAEKRGKGILNQAKGNVKEAWGDLTDNPKSKLEGKVDRLKGRAQEDLGNLIDPEPKVKKDPNRSGNGRP